MNLKGKRKRWRDFIIMVRIFTITKKDNTKALAWALQSNAPKIIIKHNLKLVIYVNIV